MPTGVSYKTGAKKKSKGPRFTVSRAKRSRKMNKSKKGKRK